MKNIFKNFYCDYVFLLSKNINFINKIIFLFDKYIYLFLLIFRLRLTVKLFGKKYLSGDKYGLLSFQIMLKDFYDYYFIFSLNNPVIFDVGGHVGNFALAASVIYKNSKTYVFEPILNTYNLLSENTGQYQNIEIYNLAIGDNNASCRMYFADNELDRSSFIKNNILKQENIKFQEVTMTKLSSFVFEHNIPKIDLLKIDVEGFEVEVLKGSVEILDRIKNIIIEVHVDKDGKRLMDLFNIFYNFGFRVVRFGKIWQDNEVRCFDIILEKI